MYIDLVVVRHKGTDSNPYLFIAPKFSHLSEGDMVEVETYKGPSQGSVLGSCTVTVDSEAYKCFSIMAKNEPLKKVLRVFKANNLVYEEEKEESV